MSHNFFEIQEYLIRKFGVVEASTIILMDAISGNVINFQGNKHILKDPKGVEFPWKQRSVSQILDHDQLMTCKAYKETGSVESTSNHLLPPTRIKGIIKGFFFAAFWVRC